MQNSSGLFFWLVWRTILNDFYIFLHAVHKTQHRSFLGIWSYLLKKSLMENFIFCAVAEAISLFGTDICLVVFLSFFFFLIANKNFSSYHEHKTKNFLVKTNKSKSQFLIYFLWLKLINSYVSCYGTMHHERFCTIDVLIFLVEKFCPFHPFLHEKRSFPLRISYVMWPNPQFPADLVIWSHLLRNP